MNVEEFIVEATRKPDLKERLKGCKSVDDFLAFASEQGHAFDRAQVMKAFEVASPDVAGQSADPLDELGGEAFTRRG